MYSPTHCFPNACIVLHIHCPHVCLVLNIFILWWFSPTQFLFATVSDSSINSWESWFIFNLRKINTNQYYESISLNVRNCKHITGTHDNTWKWAYNNYCTYLNSHLLEAPREYVLHGLVPGLNFAPFWPPPLSMHLVAMPSPVSFCLLQRVRFHT